MNQENPKNLMLPGNLREKLLILPEELTSWKYIIFIVFII